MWAHVNFWVPGTNYFGCPECIFFDARNALFLDARIDIFLVARNALFLDARNDIFWLPGMHIFESVADSRTDSIKTRRWKKRWFAKSDILLPKSILPQGRKFGSKGLNAAQGAWGFCDRGFKSRGRVCSIIWWNFVEIFGWFAGIIYTLLTDFLLR